jgi:hypothetical protein
MPAVFALHAGAIPAFFVMFLSLMGKTDGRPRKLQGPHRPAGVRLAVPAWVKIASVVALANIVGTEATSPMPPGTEPVVRAQARVLVDAHDRIVRPLGDVEFEAFAAYHLQALSAFWILFYFLPTACFMFVKQTQLYADDTVPPGNSDIVAPSRFTS